MSTPASASADTTSDPAALRIGQVVAGRYVLEALLGTGATGAVYRAAHPGGHHVAVKILDKELMDSDVAQRFARESQLMLSIHHPHVVRTLAAGRDPQLGILYLVMPLLEGRDLEGVLERHGALDPTVAVRIALQAARGISAAHRLGVVHRDIKPGNLFLDTAPDGRVLVRVCDFGIAKGAFGNGDAGITRTGTQLGTPDYISPEQLKDSKSVDFRADLWGLGATLYEMLSGQPPFAHHARVFDVVAAILGEEIAWLQERAPWIDGPLATVVHRMLRRNPKERYDTMDQLIAALLPFSNGDGGLTRAELAPVSPILRKIQKPRVAPPEPQQRPARAQPARAVASAAAHAPPPVGASPVAASPVAASPVATKRGAATAPPRTPVAPSRRRRGRAGRILVALFLLTLAATAALFWLGLLPWRPLFDWLITRVPVLAAR